MDTLQDGDGIGTPHEAESYRPLSFAQERLWFVQQLNPSSSAYNISSALHLAGELNRHALEQSLNEIIARHEALRTTYHVVAGQVRQTVARRQPLTLRVTNLRACDEPLQEARRLMAEEVGRPFALGRGPLVRACLFQLAELEHVLLLTIHHISFDYWSGLVLLGELGALYEAFSTGRSSPLPDLPLQYADFVRWQREWLRGATLEKLATYWRRRLENAPASSTLPADKPHETTPSGRGEWQSIALTTGASRALRELSLREGATLFMTLMAVFKVLLYRHTGQTDILFGTPTAARNRPEFEGLIGFFVNMLVLRTDLSGNVSFRTVLDRVRESAIWAYEHQDMPWEKLVDELHLGGEINHHPLFQVVFTHQRVPAEPPRPGGLRLTMLESANRQAKFDLTALIVEKGEDLTLSVEYNADKFEAATVTRLLRHYKRLTESIVERPEAGIDDLEMLTEEEKALLSKPISIEQLSSNFPF
jgi:aspartate racemase